MRNRIILAASVGLAATIPVLAQNATEPTPQPANEVSATPATTAPAQSPATGRPTGGAAVDEVNAVEVLDELQLEPPPPPVEIPDFARRDPAMVGGLDPVALGLGTNPWGDASGAFLSTLLRRMDTPIASRWTHIALRNALFAEARAPRYVNSVDWVAERAWLLLRMGEADAARILVSGVDVDRFTPKMFQVAMQSALANADPSGLCPLQEGLEEVEPRVAPLIDAMCAALSGEPESASAQIETARRRGRVGGIDLNLAEKVIGAATDTGRAVTIEWEPVERVNTWRFGLATATAMSLPDRLLEDAPLQLRAWHARAPFLPAQQRLESARMATGLGVLSSQALTDVYSAIYDSTDSSELSETDAWQLRLAFAGANEEARLAAMRRLWQVGEGPLDRYASRALLARAAALIEPNADLEQDAGDLIASMLAGGLDRHAARWGRVVRAMDESFADAAWSQLALGSPDGVAIDVSAGRINAFISRDSSAGKQRSALLVAGLAGLGRIDGETADGLNQRHNLRIERRTRWTRLIDRSGAMQQPGVVLVLAGTGFQAETPAQIPSSHMFHVVAALKRSGQDYIARMIAAEALARA